MDLKLGSVVVWHTLHQESRPLHRNVLGGGTTKQSIGEFAVTASSASFFSFHSFTVCFDLSRLSLLVVFGSEPSLTHSVP